MKIRVEVDCTPDEARQFLGLPDVKPLQQAAMARLEQQMAEAANALSPEALLKTWLSFVPQTPEQLRDIFGSLFRAPGGTRRSDHPIARNDERPRPPGQQHDSEH